MRCALVRHKAWHTIEVVRPKASYLPSLCRYENLMVNGTWTLVLIKGPIEKLC